MIYQPDSFHTQPITVVVQFKVAPTDRRQCTNLYGARDVDEAIRIVRQARRVHADQSVSTKIIHGHRESIVWADYGL